MNSNTHLTAPPQSVAGVFRTAFNVYRTAFGACLVYGALFALVQLLPSIYRAFWAPRVFGLRATDPGVWVVYVVCVVLTLLLLSTIILRQARVAGARPSAFGIGTALRKLWPLVLLTLSAALVLFALGRVVLPALSAETAAVRVIAVLLTTGVVYWKVPVFFALPALLLSDRQPFEAIVHSVRCVRGHWLRSFIVLLVAGLVLLVCLAAGAVPAFLWPFVVNGELVGATVVAVLASIVINALGLPFVCALILTAFEDLQARYRLSGVRVDLVEGVAA